MKLGTLCIAIAALGPATVFADPAAPATTEREDRGPHWSAPVFAAGALVFGGSYAASAGLAATSDHPGATDLYIPLVGPWLAVSNWGHCPLSDPTCDKVTTDRVLLVIDGVFQAAGVITMFDGLFVADSQGLVLSTGRTALHLAPTHDGVKVVGRF